jgi:16S rRNA (cytosine967-C5)-methyltransferase
VKSGGRSSKISVSPARAAAFDILLRIDREDAYASELLHSSQHAKLSPTDHGLATEIVMGVLRWRSLLDAGLQPASSQKLEKLDAEVLCALRMGLYQLRFLQRVPARAAIHESVELVKRARKASAAGFVNAVLRKLNATAGSATGVQETDQLADVAGRFAHPQWVIERWQEQYGLEAAKKICAYDQQVPQTAIRLWDPATEEELKAQGIGLLPGALVKPARRIVSGDVTRARAFIEGRLAVQDEASQVVASLVGHGKRILDCCAAPGGKTSILAHRNADATVVAVELHPHRARLLRRLVHATNAQIVAADARQLPFSAEFDRVLVDVPCSGTGTLARNPEIKWRLKAEDLLDLQARQIAVLRSAMAKTAPGGRVVYSTCSLEGEENFDVIERVLLEEKSFRVVNVREELARLKTEGELAWENPETLISGDYLRTIPGVHPSDGFFAAILEKVT